MNILKSVFPPPPSFTEASLPSLRNAVVLITGASSGVGLALATMLHAQSATVYIAARTLARANEGIAKIQAAAVGTTSPPGRLVPLALDLADLRSIKPAVDAFVAREARLDVLVHNAAVMVPPAGSKSAQGYDLEMATNCLGPFLLMRLLEPMVRSTAAMEGVESGAVRIVWVASLLEVGTPKGGVNFEEESGDPKVLDGMGNYMQTKAGVAFLAAMVAERVRDAGIVSVSLHPGIVLTELQRHMSGFQRRALGVVFKPARYAAYTELHAAFSPEVTIKETGGYYLPWGRRGTLPSHLRRGVLRNEVGGNGKAMRFYDWCEQATSSYL